MNTLASEFTTRLITLGDGGPGLRGGLHVEVRAPAEPQAGSGPVLDFIASTERLDRCDEVIVASGWRLENYRRNPVFQNAHQYGDIIFTLGRALVTEVRSAPNGASGTNDEVSGKVCDEGKTSRRGAGPAGQGAPRAFLFQRIEFATEINPVARIAYGLYKGRFLNAVSVGFVPLRWENGGARDPWRRKYLEQELLEVSAVGIPANPEAHQLAVKAGAVAKADLRESLELVRCLAEAERIRPAAPDEAAEIARRTQELIRLARELRAAIR